MVPNSTKLSPSDLAEVLFHRQYVSILQLTPSLLSRWPVGVVKNRLLGIDSCVRVLALGGEQCPSHHQLALWKHPRVKESVHKTNWFALHCIDTCMVWVWVYWKCPSSCWTSLLCKNKQTRYFTSFFVRKILKNEMCRQFNMY